MLKVQHHLPGRSWRSITSWDERGAAVHLQTPCRPPRTPRTSQSSSRIQQPPPTPGPPRAGGPHSSAPATPAPPTRRRPHRHTGKTEHIAGLGSPDRAHQCPSALKPWVISHSRTLLASSRSSRHQPAAANSRSARPQHSAVFNRRLEAPARRDEKPPRRHHPWCTHGFADGPSGSSDAREGAGSLLQAAARVPPMSPEEGDAGGFRRLNHLLSVIGKC
jgi:hypothetical protein